MFKNSLLFILLAASLLIGKNVLSQNSITYSTTGSNCSDSTSALISVYVNGGQAPYQYVLSNGALSSNNTSGIFYNLGAGMYTVSVTDALGAVVSSSGIVIPTGIYLEVNPSSISICPNSNLQISVSGGNGNYNWSAIPVDPTLMFPFNDSVLVSPIQNTVYTVATNALNTNLIFNGTFEYGDLGFLSAYSSLFPTNPSGAQ